METIIAYGEVIFVAQTICSLRVWKLRTCAGPGIVRAGKRRDPYCGLAGLAEVLTTDANFAGRLCFYQHTFYSTWW